MKKQSYLIMVLLTILNSLYDGKTDPYSLFLGSGTGAADDGGNNRNTAVGVNAYNSSVDGYANTAFGNEALKLNTLGTHNAVFGTQALTNNLIGIENTAIGTNTGFNVTGSGNVLIGANVAFSQTDISNQLFIDNSNTNTPLIFGDFSTDLLRVYGTLDINNAYQFPITAGTNGQLLKTDGSGNLTWSDDTNTGATSINELSDAATDNNSLFLGVDAGTNDDGTTNFNTGTGVWSLKEVTSGSHNSAFGTTALQQLTTGSKNTVFGMGALNSVIVDSNNTVIGTQAGQNVTGSGNIFIGNQAAKTQTTISNKLFIDNSDTAAPLIYGDFENDTIRVNGHFDVSRTMSIDSGSILGQLAVNTDGSLPSESAILDLKSTSSGFLPPRMTTAQRNAISNPEEGLMIFNTESKLLDVFTGTQWKNPGFGISCGEVITDADGNLYSTVAIGNQCWMRENLNVGTMINLATGGTNNDGEQTDNGTIEKYCYDNNPANCDTTGGLYQWNEMMQYETSEQGICPDGWHIPNDSDWTTLSDYLGGDGVAGCKMKATGTAWGTSATNTSFFTGLPAGFTAYGSFSNLYDRAFWYSNTDVGEYSASYRVLMNSNCNLNGNNNASKTYGFSVRCLKY